jgi:hypothetical protein
MGYDLDGRGDRKPDSHLGDRPQFQHKTRQTQGRTAAFGADGGGLAVVQSLSVLRLSATKDEVRNLARGGIIRL